VSIRYSERLAEAGIESSVGSRGDSYDTALAEIINGPPPLAAVAPAHKSLRSSCLNTKLHIGFNKYSHIFNLLL
jgi:transposase InsO family protein